MVGYGTQLLGSTTQPFQFPVATFGAKGNGKVVTDAAMTSGQNLLTCATSAPFTTADVGAGGTQFTALATTIASYVSATQVRLTANATSTPTGGTPGAIAYYGTDDTAAIQAAINAAATYAQGQQAGYAEVNFQNLVYIIAGAPVVGTGVGGGNSQLVLPIVSEAVQKITLVFKGQNQFSNVLMNWNQLVPQASAATLACASMAGTNNGTFGPSHVVGGPIDGYGGESTAALYSNMVVVVDAVNIMVPYNTTIGGWDFFGIAECVVRSTSVIAAAVVPTAPAPIPNITTPGTAGVCGCRAPATTTTCPVST